MELLIKEDILVDHERYYNVWKVILKLYTLKIENIRQKKWKTNGSKQESIFATHL